MLLRSISKHVKDQNWFAVFLDFFIVVFGVFIGFQVQQWNEHRKNLSDTRGYLARLAADMEISIDQNEFQISTSRREVGQLNLIIRSLESCELSDADKPAFTVGLYNMGKYDLPAMVMSTIDELNATGNFQLISDEDLQRLITETIREHKTTLSLDPQFAARTIPSVNYVRSHVRFTLDKHYVGHDALDPNQAKYNFEKICTDVKFINAISTVREMTIATEALIQVALNNQINLLAALRKDLGMVGPEEENE